MASSLELGTCNKEVCIIKESKKARIISIGEPASSASSDMSKMKGNFQLQFNDAAPLNGYGDQEDAYSDNSEDREEKAALEEAFDKKVRPYIDLVDELRRHGLQQDIQLPSAVVIGDQSSGKSSILEAISGVQLPRGSGIVTRCPLELQMNKAPSHRWKAKLSYKTNRGNVAKEVADPSEIRALIEDAQNDIAGRNKGISNELITLRIESSNCPDVTLIDLPGITRTPVGDQPLDICAQIKRLLTGYIRESNTIILCVIPCNVDIATNEALSMAKEVDPEGIRTLGVLTKPDLVDKGGEADVLAILNNDRFVLKKGYNILKCRSQQDIIDDLDPKSALEQEERFFKQHPVFRKVDPEIRGTEKLALKLTDTLVDHIKNTLPKMREDVRQKLEKERQRLINFGEGPPTEEGQKRLFLMKTVDKFMQRTRKALREGDRISEGVMDRSGPSFRFKKDIEYNSCFFWRKRFLNLKTKITEKTEQHFKYEELSVTKIEEKMNRYRGRELPCFLNVDLFEKLVQEHVKRYQEDMDHCCKEISDDVSSVTVHILTDFNHLPSVKGRFHGISEETREECRMSAVDLLKFEMEKEMLVFSQDDTFLNQIRRLTKKMQEQNKQKGRNASTENGDLFSFAIGDSKGDDENDSKQTSKKNAEVMQRLLKTYIKIANRRILDSVPMILRCKQHLNFVDKLHERLQMLCSGDEVKGLVQEDNQLTIHRRNAEARAQRLSIAMNKLNYIA